jgi:endonuclease/exonuclease/phosphatase family metal-dependent hydrolase
VIWRRRVIRIGAALGGLLIALFIGGALLVRCLNYFPKPLEEAAVSCSGKAATLRPGQRFTVLSWNLQYGAGRSYHFFYDGGKAVHASRDRVEQTLGEIGEVLTAERPDVLLLQEVDRDSARSARIDQLARLRRLGRWSCWTSAPYHRSRYVPVPFGNALGRVDMHLATAARYRLAWARRHGLPQLDEWFLRQAFNLKRAILEAAVPLEGHPRPLVLLNTHLSAFSYGDGTLGRQVDMILGRLGHLDARGFPWILAGDFNMLPPGESGKKLGAEAKYYAGADNPLSRLTRRYRTAVSLEAYHKNPSRYFTYIKYGAKKPDRRIDYIFVSSDIEVHGIRVLHQPRYSSDHLPLLLTASVRPPR